MLVSWLDLEKVPVITYEIEIDKVAPDQCFKNNNKGCILNMCIWSLDILGTNSSIDTSNQQCFKNFLKHISSPSQWLSGLLNLLRSDYQVCWINGEMSLSLTQSYRKVY